MSRYVEAMDETEARSLHDELVRLWARPEDSGDDPIASFVATLCDDFGFPDRQALAEALVTAGELSGALLPHLGNRRKTDTLDELAKSIRNVVRLLKDDLNAQRIRDELGSWERTSAQIDLELADLCERLAEIAAAAKEANQAAAAARAALRARTEQKRGPLPNVDLIKLARGLAAFYEANSPRRRWSFTHQKWPRRRRGSGPDFVYRVIRHFLPDRDPDELKAVFRDHIETRNPPSGQRRGRPSLKMR